MGDAKREKKAEMPYAVPSGKRIALYMGAVFTLIAIGITVWYLEQKAIRPLGGKKEHRATLLSCC